MKSAVLIVAACCCLFAVVSTGLTKPMSMLPCPPEECGIPIPGPPCEEGWLCTECQTLATAWRECAEKRHEAKDGKTNVNQTGDLCAFPGQVECYAEADCTTAGTHCSANPQLCALGHGTPVSTWVDGFVGSFTDCTP